MTQTFEVVFQNGAFRPIADVSAAISEGQRAQVVVEVEDEVTTSSQPRVFGLHAGMGEMSDDFDEELPDSFWLGEE